MFGPMLNIINLRAAVRDELDTVNATDDTEDTINEDAVANNDMLGLHLQLTEKLYNKKEKSKYYNLKIIVSVLFISLLPLPTLKYFGFSSSDYVSLLPYWVLVWLPTVAGYFYGFKKVCWA